MRETLAKSLSDQTFACTHQWLLTTIRRNPVYSHACEVSTVLIQPLFSLPSSCASDTPAFLLLKHATILSVLSRKDFVCRPGWPWTCDPPDPTSQVLSFLFKVFIYCWKSRKWLCVLGVAVTAHMWRPEENYVESVLSACMRASGMELTARLLWQGFYLLSHLISLVFSF